jgi:hypothetical protein
MLFKTIPTDNGLKIRQKYNFYQHPDIIILMIFQRYTILLE